MDLIFIIFGVKAFACTQRRLDIRIPGYLINTSVLVCEYCILFMEVAVMFVFHRTTRGSFFNVRKMKSL